MRKLQEETEARNLDELFERYRLAPESYVFVPLADACRKMGRIDEALEICGRGVQRHPSYPSGHVVKGKCLFDKGDGAAARDTFERVLVLDENNLVALKYLGMIEADEGNLTAAERHFRQILSLDPDNQEIKTILRIVEEREEPERTPEPPSTDVMDSVNEILTGTGSLDDVAAREDGPICDATNETDALAHEKRQARSGDELETSDELASVTLAEIFASQGYTTKAEKIYREVLRRQPGSEDVRRRLHDLTSAGVDPDTGRPGGEDTVPREDERQETKGLPIGDEVAPSEESPGGSRVAPQPVDAENSATASSPDREGAGEQTPPNEARLEINEKDSLVHFRRWLTRIQK